MEIKCLSKARRVSTGVLRPWLREREVVVSRRAEYVLVAELVVLLPFAYFWWGIKTPSAVRKWRFGPGSTWGATPGLGDEVKVMGPSYPRPPSGRLSTKLSKRLGKHEVPLHRGMFEE